MSEPLRFSRGDRVKLTDRYAKALRKTKNTDWPTRRGIVTACNTTQVTIMWPGRKTPDYVLLNGVEQAE